MGDLTDYKENIIKSVAAIINGSRAEFEILKWASISITRDAVETAIKRIKLDEGDVNECNIEGNIETCVELGNKCMVEDDVSHKILRNTGKGKSTKQSLVKCLVELLLKIHIPSLFVWSRAVFTL